MAEGNRKDPRARVLNMTVRYKSATVDEFIENHSHDISRGGIFIKTRSPFPAGTLLKFEVRIAEDQKLMHGVGRVVWRREVERAEESFPAGMGIKFIKTGEGAAELINQLVAARQGVESSFDAGVRENVSSTGTRPSVVPSGAAASRPATVPPASGPSLSVDSAPRSLPSDGTETAVTNPAKKRLDLAPDKRKVVLQGPALEAQAGDSAPARERSRASIAEETTSKRTRPRAKVENKGPNVGGLLVILALVGLVVFVVNRLRGREEEPAPATSVGAEPPTAVPPALPAPEIEAARPSAPPSVPPSSSGAPATNAPAAVQPDPPVAPAEPGAAAADPNAPVDGTEAGSGTGGGATTNGVAPDTAGPASAAPAVGGSSSVAAPTPGAPTGASPTAPAPSPAPAKPPATNAVTPAPAKPAPAKPAPAPVPVKPAPKPRATAPAPTPPPPAPAPDTAKPSEPTPPPATDDNPY
jgi:uncharacterized protein (TIGR02266 family)